MTRRRDSYRVRHDRAVLKALHMGELWHARVSR